MAATDQTYRSQRTLDIVFAVSCILMLFGTLWMFWQDYHREFKSVQREFRDVEEAMNEHLMLGQLPSSEEVEAARKKVADAHRKLDEVRAEVRAIERDITAQRNIQDDIYRAIKADVDSKTSLLNIDAEHAAKADSSRRAALEADVEARKKELFDPQTGLMKQLSDAQDALDKIDQKMKDEVTSKLDGPQQGVGQAEDNLKQVTAAFDRYAKTTAQRRWKWGDAFRALPIIDGFESPTKIKQLWLPELTIDYGGFKDVPRFDRCISCHLAIERGPFERSALTRLTRSPDLIQKDLDKAQAHKQEVAGNEEESKRADESIKKLEGELNYAKGLEGRLETARQLLAERAANEKLGFDPDDLPSKVMWPKLTPGQITQYAAHPRLDLFVDANSAHPMERFGCTICHQGQGSATDFLNAAHTPANATREEEWKNQYGWAHNHFWDFPMLSSRFTESSCIKCHHEVTDLVRYGSKEEAPKLLRGYRLVQDNGCFGCHEISSIKAGKEVGPDLRLEPSPALEYLTPTEQETAKKDPLNLPGAYRKAGPSLRRLAEKTNRDWVRKWIQAPRGFRPDTKMPHFYGLYNNSAANLPDDQKKFPDAEIDSIAYYLLTESQRGALGKDTIRVTLENHLHTLQGDLKRSFLADRERKDLLDTSRKLGDLALLSVPSGADEINRYLTQQKDLQEHLQELFRKQASLQAQQAPLQKRQAALKAKKDGGQELSAQESEELDKATDTLNQLSKELKDMPAELSQNGKDLDDVTGKLLAASKYVPLSKKITDEFGKIVTVPDAPKAADLQKHQANGRRLFTEKGCMACHSHEGTTTAGLGVPAVHGQANFGPDLSRVALKIAPEFGGPEAKRRWVIQWVLNPTVYHPRTRMPITHLSPQDASDVADWLLSQKPEWDEKGPDKPSTQDLVNLARVYLGKAPGFTRQEVNAFLPAESTERPGVPLERLLNLPIDADEWGLEEITDDNLRWYIGRKAINRLGCFGCHDVPGFETAKPIGTALNDWGKKDPERLAFEDIDVYVHDNYNIVNVRNNPDDARKPAGDWHVKDGKAPYEEIYYQALEHHRREGFIHQKLNEPRSYDFNRVRTWDDRLRMPQFRFARSKQKDGESDEAYRARQEFEEAEAREAVMTFILGLVAEPMPLKYLHKPAPDRLAEVKGHQVLEKFNCAGCHQVRSGLYEFQPTSENLTLLQDAYRRDHKAALEKDHVFAGHNAWIGLPQTMPDRLVAFGTGPRDDPNIVEDRKMLVVRLSDALRFSGTDGLVRDLPAATPIPIAPESLISRADPWGGTFADLMVQYLSQKDRDKYKLQNGDNDLARSMLPPPLIREGERVQPNWLYGFLLNPPAVRPQNYMQLRMPKFNMSHEDARALANYFSSVSRLTNPGAGVSAEYVTVRQRDELYWRNRTKEYVALLKKEKKYDERLEQMEPVWADYLKRQIAEAEAGLDAAKQAARDTPEGEARKQKEQDVKNREDNIKLWKGELEKKNFDRLKKQWEEEGAYATDAYRLLTDRNLCLQCHSIGDVASALPQGPNLALSAQRLRPEWVRQWLANPDRLFGYKPAMPQNFPRNPIQYQNVFAGSSLDQVTAVRDVLMDLPRLADLPGNRSRAPVAPGGGK